MKDATAVATEVELNAYGYQLLLGGQVDKGIEMLALNASRHPESANVWDSLGEAYATKGDKDNAIKNFKKSLGLNPLTQPLSYMTLSGKLTLYATRAATDQLRKLYNVSLEVVSRQLADDILTVRVKARMPDGREDEDLGSVAFPSLLKGEARANAVMKAVTKAKRRATLSICGLGWLDETEVETIPGAEFPPHDPQTGEITESAVADEQAPLSLAPSTADAAPATDASPRDVGAALLLEQMAQEAAKRGPDVFNEFYKNRTIQERAIIAKHGKELRRLMDEAPAPEVGE